MRVTQTVKIAQIDYGKRLPLNKKVMWFALEILLRKTIFPPISLERKRGGRFALKDGRNRLAAHLLTGKTEIRANLAIKEDPRPDKPLVTLERRTTVPVTEPMELLRHSPE